MFYHICAGRNVTVMRERKREKQRDQREKQHQAGKVCVWDVRIQDES